MITEGRDSKEKPPGLVNLRPATSDVSGAVGLFGGSFDPLHIGHLALCDYLLAYPELSGIEHIWFMPTPQNPLKEQETSFSYEWRCRMIEQAIQSDPRYELCTIESMLPEPHYTLDTITALEEHYSHCAFSLIIGADSLASLSQWYRHGELMDRLPLVVYPRSGYDLSQLADQYPTAQIRLMSDAPQIEVSSTAIRQALHEGRDLRHWLPLPELYDTLSKVTTHHE